MYVDRPHTPATPVNTLHLPIPDTHTPLCMGGDPRIRAATYFGHIGHPARGLCLDQLLLCLRLRIRCDPRPPICGAYRHRSEIHTLTFHRGMIDVRTCRMRLAMPLLFSAPHNLQAHLCFQILSARHPLTMLCIVITIITIVFSPCMILSRHYPFFIRFHNRHRLQFRCIAFHEMHACIVLASLPRQAMSRCLAHGGGTRFRIHHHTRTKSTLHRLCRVAWIGGFQD